MKKLVSALLATAMLFSLAACGGGEKPGNNGSANNPGSNAGQSNPVSGGDVGDVANDPKVTLVYAEVNPLDTIVGQTASEFKRLVEEKSGGSITIDVRDSGVLGSENDVLDAIIGGDDSIDMSRISAFALTSYGAEKSVLLSLPFTFESRDHWWNFANSDLAAEFLNEPQEIGLPLRGIFYGEEGFRHFFANVPLTSIDSMKGLKVRVSNDPIMNGMVESLGGSPTVFSFGELYSALNTGVCAAAEQPIANYKSNAFPEVANNLILDGHTLGAIQCVITDTAWAKLTPAQQAVIMEAGKEVQKFNQNLSQSAEDEVLQQLKDEGCNVVDVPDKGPWQEACSSAPAIKEAIDKQADLYQQILGMK